MAIPQKQLAGVDSCCDWRFACKLQAWWKIDEILYGVKTPLPAPFLPPSRGLKWWHYWRRRASSSVSKQVIGHPQLVLQVQSSFLNNTRSDHHTERGGREGNFDGCGAHYRVVCINYTVPFYDSSGVRDNYLYFDTFRFWWYSTCTVICFLTPWPSVRMHTTFTFTQSPMK